MDVSTVNEYGKKLHELLILRYSPIALKVLHEGDTLPADCVRPFADEGGHIAMCQAFARVRRERAKLTMLKDDHWCVWPLVSYGMVDIPESDVDDLGSRFFTKTPELSIKYFREKYPRLNDSKVIGFSIAPLESCSFVPDVITIYCRPAQIRSLQMAAKFDTGEMLDLTLDPVDSCVHSTIPVLNGQAYNITFPDPGEYERAMADEDEVMFTVRGDKLADLVDSMSKIAAFGFGYKGLQMTLPTDFPRPKFYNDYFEKWGLATGPEWKK
ncbi:MAG: DUF169 domain-containing protein [Oscillospiraceae bacterium]|nr:DUF169 domain-containing protein [Oscillospiraceae bacterium]